MLFIVTCKRKPNLSDTQPFQGLRHHAVKLTKVCIFGIVGHFLLAVCLTYWKKPAVPPIDSWLTEEVKGFQCQANTALFVLSFNQIVISAWKCVLHAQHSAVELLTLFMIWTIMTTAKSKLRVYLHSDLVDCFCHILRSLSVDLEFFN